MKETLNHIEEKIAELLKHAKKQKKNAEKAKHERYFEGQKDVLKQMLAELAKPCDDIAQDGEDLRVRSCKKKLAASLKNAKEQRKNTKNAKDAKYFRGQQDVLKLLLSELKGP